MILYAWLLGVIGIYGDAAATFMRTASLYILKYGSIILGAVLIIVLPMRINFALERNKRLRDEAIATARAQAELAKKLREDRQKELIAKKYEEMNNV